MKRRKALMHVTGSRLSRSCWLCETQPGWEGEGGWEGRQRVSLSRGEGMSEAEGGGCEDRRTLASADRAVWSRW